MENLHSRLEQYAPIFSDHRQRVERTAGLDALLNAQWRVVENHMNALLDAYHIELIQEATGAQPVQAPIEEEVYDGVGAE